MDPDGGCAQASKFDGVASIEAVDASTVKVTFTAPKPNPYTAFVGALSPIIQKAQFADCIGAAAPTCTDQNISPDRHRPLHGHRLYRQRHRVDGRQPELPRPDQAGLCDR